MPLSSSSSLTKTAGGQDMYQPIAGNGSEIIPGDDTIQGNLLVLGSSTLTGLVTAGAGVNVTGAVGVTGDVTITGTPGLVTGGLTVSGIVSSTEIQTSPSRTTFTASIGIPANNTSTPSGFTFTQAGVYVVSVVEQSNAGSVGSASYQDSSIVTVYRTPGNGLLFYNSLQIVNATGCFWTSTNVTNGAVSLPVVVGNNTANPITVRFNVTCLSVLS
jgi:hypothetical protein